jgi:phage terminase small subunit
MTRTRYTQRKRENTHTKTENHALIPFPNRICPQRNPNQELTLREELFVRAICCYPPDPTFDNMCEAMRKAGYKGKHIGVNAAVIMRKPKIATAIDKYRAKIMREFDIAPKKILQEIAATAFSNFQDFYSDDGSLKNIKALERSVSAALHGVDVQYGKGLDGQTYVTQKIRLHDKLKGLELLGKYHKLFTDQVNITNLDGTEVSADERAEQTRQRLLANLKNDEDDGKE